MVESRTAGRAIGIERAESIRKRGDDVEENIRLQVGQEIDVVLSNTLEQCVIRLAQLGILLQDTNRLR